MTQPMSPALEQASRVLEENNLANEARLLMLITTERSGRDPIALANRLVRFARAGK